MGDDFDEDLERCQRRIGLTLRGKWRLEALIGVGGMAAVYAASHRMGNRAAIKVLHPHIAVSKEMRARFEQEALAIGRLGHPGTVQVLDVDVTEDGAPFMVMELLDGESLGQLAYRTRLSETELLRYAAALLDVLCAAHAAGIVHRDIKPDNLFVTRDGRLKVLDFGIARMKEGTGNVQTRTGAMLGTTSYMAPEQIHGRPIDGRADVFAVGATMFRLLSEKRIHEAETDAELLIKMGSMPAPSLRSVMQGVDPRIARIVDRALTFDRDRRYPDAATMLEDVRAVIGGTEPPFSTRAAAVNDAPTRGDSSVDAVAASRRIAEAPTMYASASAVPAPAASSPSHAVSALEATSGGLTKSAPQERRTSIAFAVGIGASTLILGGLIALPFVIGQCGSSSKAAASERTNEDDERDSDARRPQASTARTSGKKKLRGEELEREVSKYVEDAQRRPKKKPKKKKKEEEEEVFEEQDRTRPD
ncbi:MAG: serine/threonine protein kinase [Polyangiaceae bacterium]|nr:serine/threonine protein kinase [Polyangiaceae bacterium]